MADVYREKVASLCLALESEESRTRSGLRLGRTAAFSRDVAVPLDPVHRVNTRCDVA
jgi:hypothetical protein